MGFHSWVVRPLSNYNDTNKTNSDAYDIGDAVEVHAILKVTATAGTSPSLTVTGQSSIDGHHWADLAGLAFTAATAATIETKSSTADAFRYLRFQYNLAGTNPQATFEVSAFVKTRGAGLGGAPPLLGVIR